MKALLSTLLLVLLPACAGVPRDVDTVVQDVRAPELAAQHARLGSRLDQSMPVYLREDPLLEIGYLGLSQRMADSYLIMIDPRLDPMLQQAVLVHEWAHVLVWDSGADPARQHGVEWGVAYSRVFEAWAGEDK